MAEDIEPAAGTPEGAATPEDSGYSQILAGEGAAPTPAAEGEEPVSETPAKPEQTALDPEEVLTFEIDGKDVPIKRKDISKLAELSTREQTLTEKEKSLNKDYTTKTQALAETRKSLETAFGRMPEPQELNALGKLWKSYFTNPQVKQAIDGILSGKVGQPQPGQESEIVSSLKAEIEGLKEELYGFRDSITERETQQAQAQGQRAWNDWVQKKAESGVKITEETEQQMIPFIGAIRHAHQDWDAARILDEALRHASIDSLEQGAVKKALTTADEAKKGKVPKITPKVQAKSDKDMTYAEIMASAS